MNIITASLRNFGSFESLDINFEDQGLTLIHGPTGSGKSTLCDAIPWCLFGRTAKNGAVDDVLRWQSTEPTFGWLTIEHQGATVDIMRHRGAKPKDNDLYFRIERGPDQRGKDITDTQRMINQLLGLDASLYLSGAYFHEFSETAAFFTATAKHRRAICEQLVDLALPVKLQANLTKAKQAANKAKQAALTETQMRRQEETMLADLIVSESAKADRWDASKVAKLSELAKKHASFEDDKTRESVALMAASLAWSQTQTNRETILQSKIDIETAANMTLPGATQCPTCGAEDLAYRKAVTAALLSADRVKNYKRELAQPQVNPHLAALNANEARVNTYQDQIEQLQAQVNPHSVDGLEDKYHRAGGLLAKAESALSVASIRLSDLEILDEVNAALRATLIQTTIQTLETDTNRLLSDYFEAEIRVTFEVADADKLDVSIMKDGNACVYAQLSKGQRQLLKLCFGISVMRSVSNHHGIKFNAIFLDEPLEGLDERLKLMAYRLLESLSIDYTSVFIVDHSPALKAHFTNTIEVCLSGEGSSSIEKT